MKHQTKFIFLISFIAIFLARTESVFAQYERPRSADNSVLSKRNAFISVGSGIHYKYGLLGLGFGMMLNENVLGELNVGIGGYGYKSGFTAIFNAGSNKKWRPTLGFSRASGSNATQFEVEVVHQLLNYTITTEVDLAPAYVLTPGFQRVIVFRKGSNLAFDFGLAIALNTPSYQLSEDFVTIDGKMVSTNAVEFSDTQKLAFRLLRPSGIKIGISYNFGL
jgi:hypothetical protein